MDYFSDRNERTKHILYMENTGKETVTSKRELALQRLKSKYPEDNLTMMRLFLVELTEITMISTGR